MYAVSPISPIRICAVRFSSSFFFCFCFCYMRKLSHTEGNPAIVDFLVVQSSFGRTTSLTLHTLPPSRTHSPPPTRIHRPLSPLRLDREPSTQHSLAKGIRGQVPQQRHFHPSRLGRTPGRISGKIQYSQGFRLFSRIGDLDVASFYQAVTDNPCVYFAPELIAAYPEAQVILQTRDLDS